MESEWNNKSRFDSINVAIDLLPHTQSPIGMGFRLRHDPTRCYACKARISLLELSGIIHSYESYFEAEKEGMTVDD